MTAPRSADQVDLWIIPTDQPDSVLAELSRLLDPGERARAAGPDPALGRRFTVVRGAVRLLVAERLGVPRPNSPGGAARTASPSRWTGTDRPADGSA
ncbi:hypothetical protein ACFQ0M_42610 [Kitasatospora aburaviensis]